MDRQHIDIREQSAINITYMRIENGKKVPNAILKNRSGIAVLNSCIVQPFMRNIIWEI